MGILAWLGSLVGDGADEVCPHCGRRVSVITRVEPTLAEPESWPVLVCRRHGIVGAVRPEG